MCFALAKKSSRPGSRARSEFLFLFISCTASQVVRNQLQGVPYYVGKGFWILLLFTILKCIHSYNQVTKIKTKEMASIWITTDKNAGFQADQCSTTVL